MVLYLTDLAIQTFFMVLIIILTSAPNVLVWLRLMKMVSIALFTILKTHTSVQNSVTI